MLSGIPQGWKHKGIPVADFKKRGDKIVHFASANIPDMGFGEDVCMVV